MGQHHRHRRAGLFIGLVMFSAALWAAPFPNHDIRVIVPWAPGGGTDAIVRKITNLAEQSLPASMYVENIKGGMSATGLLQLMGTRATGYTLGALTYDSVITVPWEGMLPGYTLDKLKLIARITNEPDALIVPSNSNYHSLKQLLHAAKASPGKIRVGIQNRGSRTAVTLLLLEKKAGVQFKAIAYPGGAAAQTEALLDGEVDCVVTSLGDLSQLIKAGRARGLVEFSDRQNKAFPKVPPARQVGLNLQMGSFIVLAVPAHTPDAAVKVLEKAYKTAFDHRTFQHWLSTLGVRPSWLGRDKVGQWARRLQKNLFATMNGFAKAGLLKK